MLRQLKSLRDAISGQDSILISSLDLSAADLDALSLAIATLEKLRLEELAPAPLQIAVLGPTQAGKSTLVNLLCGRVVTSVSPLAGHTRHARGAAFGVAEEVLDGIAVALEPAVRVVGADLDALDLDQYVLQAFALDELARDDLPTTLAASGGCIVWDTPDFDSLAADTYRRAVLAIAGLADVIVLIASRDKYGDLAVWDTLAALRPLQRHSLMVINKVDVATVEALATHIDSTQQARFGSRFFDVEFIEHAPSADAVDARAVLAKLASVQPIEPAGLREGVMGLSAAHWQTWTAPLLAEQACRVAWQAELSTARVAFEQGYQRDYLADADRYDTLQRLIAELLVLLEIPVLARTMGTVRRVITWPVRQFFKRSEAQVDLGREPELLRDGCTHLLLALQTAAVQPAAAHPFWGVLARKLQQNKTSLTDDFTLAAAAHHAAFSASVEAAARGLYARLQEQPALLNSLRVARAGADAAGVVVALQTGGIGLSDLVLTPVMLSLTSTLTESAAKGYVDQAMAQLKQQQFLAVQQLLDDALIAPLTRMVAEVESTEFTGLALSELERARSEFEQAAL